MSEIRLSTEDHDIDDLLRYLDGDHHMSVYDRSRVANAIRAQLPKPAIQEPTEFGSIVRATEPHGRRLLWQADYRSGSHYWQGNDGTIEVWSELTDVEVLRVGIGETSMLKPFFEGVAEGFCSCHGSERALDCGVSAHRREARIHRDPMDDAEEPS